MTCLTTWKRAGLHRVTRHRAGNRASYPTVSVSRLRIRARNHTRRDQSERRLVGPRQTEKLGTAAVQLDVAGPELLTCAHQAAQRPPVHRGELRIPAEQTHDAITPGRRCNT